MSSIVVLWRTIWPDGGAADNWMESTPIAARNEADAATVAGRD